MEALLLAGGKAERLGEAAQGHPKPLVPVAGSPLAEYTVARLVAAGVTRVIVACRAGQEDVFVNALGGLGAEIDPVGEPEPLGRGGGLRLAASRRRDEGPVLRAVITSDGTVRPALSSTSHCVGTLSSTSTWCVGDCSRAHSNFGASSSAFSTTAPPEPPMVKLGRKITG